MNQQLIALVIVGLIVLAIILMAVVVIASGRKSGEQKRQTAAELGFTLLDPPPADVVERLIPLHQKGYHQNLEVRHLQQQRRADCSVYLYDVWDAGSNDLETSDALAIVAADLDLPRFAIAPKVQVVGWTGDMANQFIEKLVGLHSQVIKFDSHPHFEHKFLVSGDDELAVRRYLAGPVLAALMQTQSEGLVISAWGDALTINAMNIGGSAQKEDPAGDVRSRRDLALALYERLRQM
jgi:hypothetical protein